MCIRQGEWKKLIENKKGEELPIVYIRIRGIYISLFDTNLRDLFQIHEINMSIAIWVGFLALFGIATDAFFQKSKNIQNWWELDLTDAKINLPDFCVFC